MSETGCLWAYDMPGNSSPAKEVTNNIKLSLIVSESIKQISMSVSLIRSFRTHRAYAVSTGRVMNSYRKNKYIFSNSPPHHFFARTEKVYYICIPIRPDNGHTVDVAQSVRASDCGSEGRGFEPHLPPLKAVATNCKIEQNLIYQ